MRSEVDGSPPERCRISKFLNIMRQRILLKAFLIKISSKSRTIEGNGTAPFTRSEGDGERPGQLTEHSYTRISPFKVQIMRGGGGGGGIGQS